MADHPRVNHLRVTFVIEGSVSGANYFSQTIRSLYPCFKVSWLLIDYRSLGSRDALLKIYTKIDLFLPFRSIQEKREIMSKAPAHSKK